jgi:DNA-binding NarL/FixJ family response regulator
MHLLSVYLVEDSAVIRDNLASTLAELAQVQLVGWAADEDSASRWLALAQPPPDLLIVDLFLEQGSGLGVLRTAAGRPHSPTRVVLSNYASAAIRRQCLSLGADRVFDKSTEIDALIAYCLARPRRGDASQAGSPPTTLQPR